MIRAISLWVAVLVLAGASAALAGVSWVEVGGGSSHYSMGDFADGTTSYRGFTPKAGSLRSGSLLHAAVGVNCGEVWSFGLAYDRCGASTTATSASYLAEAQVPLDIFKIEPGRFLHRRGGMCVGIGAGIGVAHLAGSAEMTNGAGRISRGSADAVAPAFDASLNIEFFPVRNLAVVGSIGARYVKFKEIRIGMVPLSSDVDGAVVEPNYSGGFVRLGLKWQLPVTGSGI